MRKTLEDYPNLVKEFDFKKNTPLTPKDLSYGSKKKIWWKCIKSHEWIVEVNERTIGNNCPYCSGHRVSKENSLKFLFPKVAKDWHPTKNGNLKSEEFTKSSAKKVWWLCPKGHEYETRLYSRTNKNNPSGCPHCFAKRRGHNRVNIKKEHTLVTLIWRKN
jgi:DNA-directed RNA polymerase subunit RPC12/RpoP